MRALFFMTGTFNTPTALKLGDEICAAISIIPTYK